jgi:hypothetical protein
MSTATRESVAVMEIFFKTDTTITLAEDKQGPEAGTWDPVNLPERSDETGILEYISSEFRWKIKKAEGARRSLGTWTFRSKYDFVSQVSLIPFLVVTVIHVETQLKFEKHARKIA